MTSVRRVTRVGCVFASRLPPCAAALLLAAAAGPATPLRPGLWRFTNTPAAATLNGKTLSELPVGPIASETICLTPDQAARPARWLARDLLADCSLTREEVRGGRADIAGSCPSRDPGLAPGTLRITGRVTPVSYTLHFETVANGENGRMGFSGEMAGERVGDCPARAR